MPTQIAATPVIKGKDAYRILSESQRKTSEKAKAGAKKLDELFKDMIK